MTSNWTSDIEAAVAAPRLFKAAILDWHNLAPKIDPEVSASPVSGDGIGSIRQFTFGPGAPFAFMKERVDFIDVEKCEAKLTLIEGGFLGTDIESATAHFKIEPTAGGSMAKVSVAYTPLLGVNIVELTEKAKAMFTGVIKGCEAYLLANPDAYN